MSIPYSLYGWNVGFATLDIKNLGHLLYNSAQYRITTEPYSLDNMGGVVYGAGVRS